MFFADLASVTTVVAGGSLVDVAAFGGGSFVRYHHDVAEVSLAEQIQKGNEDGLLISSVASCSNLWTLIMDAGTGFTSQVYRLSPLFLDKEWIMKQWEEGYYISAIAGANNGSSLVVMSKGTGYLDQLYRVSENFPFNWIKDNREERYQVTAMATAGNRWAIVMSLRHVFSDQIVELDFMYPREGLHIRRDDGYTITSSAATCDLVAFVLTLPSKNVGVRQETVQTKGFPGTLVKERWAKNFYITSMCYGRTGS